MPVKSHRICGAFRTHCTRASRTAGDMDLRCPHVGPRLERKGRRISFHELTAHLTKSANE